jgi:hypothetical protein
VGEKARSEPLPPPEYMELLGAVVRCLAGDPRAPLHTTDEVLAWLHGVTREAVERALTGDTHMLLARTARCLREKTHDPRLADLTPEQIAYWCQQARREDVRTVLVKGAA